MTDSDRSPDIVEKAMAQLCNSAVSDGPTSELLDATARRLCSVETNVSVRKKRRELMFRIARYTSVAVVATFLLTTVVWVVLLDRSASVAFAQVKYQVVKVQSVQYVESRTNDGKPDNVRRHKILGRHLSRTETLGKDGTVEHIDIVDAKNGKLVTIDPKQKEFVVLRPHQTEEETKPMPEVDFYKRIREVPDELTKRLPNITIAGRTVVGFYYEKEKGGATWKNTYWIDADTKLPVRIERSVRYSEPQAPASDWVLSDFVFDEELDTSLFSTEPPAGYTVKTEKIFSYQIP